jgi:two-component system, NtrC family, nitrogen regulation sensor histidine kinase NtrY
VTKRVAKVVAATQQAALGDLGVRVEIQSSDEIGTLAESFNRMMNEMARGRDRIVYLEKVSSWQEIARRLAHEIKNPLTPIQLAVQELHRSYKGEDDSFISKLDDSLEIVEEEVATLRRLVETFSEFAKMPTVQAELQDLNAFVNDFLKLHPQYAGQVEFLPAPDSLLVQLDRILMGRVLSNLIDNGLEASLEDRGVEIRVERDRNWALLLVRDHGQGMTEDVREHLFQPYFTSKVEGTGLGLAIVKKIVLQHGGEISVADGEGQGSVFTLRLRLAETPNKVKRQGGA